MSTSSKSNHSASMVASAATASSTAEDEVRLKLELAQVTAATDTKRLHSRTLISERDGLRADTERITAETEGQKKIMQQIKESNEKLREQIKAAEDERRQLLNLIDGDGESSIARR